MMARALLAAGLLMVVASGSANSATAETPSAASLPAAAASEVQYKLQLPQMPLHDPFMVADKASRTYYLYTSNYGGLTGTRGPGTMMYTSRDLKNWSSPRIVFTLPAGTWAKGGAWAPEVHEWRGRWYLFTTFHDEAAMLPPIGKRKPYRRGTIAAVADNPAGPFQVLRNGEPVAPKELMTLDGSLYVDPAGKPWFVYAHEWLQAVDGAMEALPLKPEDLSANGPPQLLFRASDASWADPSRQSEGDVIHVTDGPQLFRTKTGTLLMLWSSYNKASYVQAQARSKSGNIAGPWEQLDPLLGYDSGHGMLFNTFEGQLMLVVHRPFKNARGKLYEMRDAGDHLEVVRQRIDLDGDPKEYLGGIGLPAVK